MEERERECFLKGLYQAKKNPLRSTMIDYFFQYYDTDEVFFHAIEIYDLYMSKKQHSIDLDCDIAKSIVWISIKFHDNNIAPDPSFLNLQKIEKEILETIDYTLHFPTIYTFIQYLDLKDCFQYDLLTVLCYLSTFRISRYYLPSIIVQSAYLLSCKLLQRSPLHFQEMYNPLTINDCMSKINKMYKVLLKHKNLNCNHFIIKTYALLDYVPALDF